ncbi:EF-P beta-lysylation protein EpmB [Thioalkalivibrio sp. XN8]|uniref:EF-P beta-lysylation protein EpmB n=1 Tax=Thioalkalivibrio sp. XN8 TaxID=2712863 RepID=UPI0013EBAD44|nr:EF-P beta-lysylation protein EpmB [Thioalkalivibrio sp. XN8]NGP52915.1 EF-P beta-lysylation protein EpmB [Thioalkalivibrio sp. XN8]
MITPGTAARHLEPWRRELAAAVTDPAELLELLGLDPGLLPGARAATAHFGLKVPRSFITRMRPGDPHDPLLRQVLPLGAETLETPGYGADPVGDLAALRAPGVLAKYRGRALLMTTGGCAVNCRYCFRREFPYDSGALTPTRLSAAVAELAALPGLDEVILSGGDPLALPTARLARITAALAGLPGLRRLRLHTRTPVVLPARVDELLLGWLRGLPWPVAMVVHVNHPRELSPELRAALAALAGTGARLLNQAVLLRGVNDDAEVLAELSAALFDAGVLPYYLHLLDRARGTAHFEVPAAEAVALHGELAARLPGYLVPRLVQEVEGAPAKLPVTGLG